MLLNHADMAMLCNFAQPNCLTVNQQDVNPYIVIWWLTTSSTKGTCQIGLTQK